MDEMTRLKLLTDERDGTADNPIPRMFTDEELKQLLELHEGNVRACAYDILIRKAENTEITLPNGLALPDQSAHYLRRAAKLRPIRTRNAARADDPPPKNQKGDTA